MSEVKPVWKGSVYFRDWCGYGPFHFPFDNVTKFPEEHTPRAAEHEYHYYETLYDSPDHRSKGEEIVEQRASPMYYAPESGRYRKYRYVAYHLNTERFNSFLRDLCRERDVSLVEFDPRGHPRDRTAHGLAVGLPEGRHPEEPPEGVAVHYARVGWRGISSLQSVRSLMSDGAATPPHELTNAACRLAGARRPGTRLSVASPVRQ
jgi:hypothetical protein